MVFFEAIGGLDFYIFTEFSLKKKLDVAPSDG